MCFFASLDKCWIKRQIINNKCRYGFLMSYFSYDKSNFTLAFIFFKTRITWSSIFLSETSQVHIKRMSGMFLIVDLKLEKAEAKAGDFDQFEKLIPNYDLQCQSFGNIFTKLTSSWARTRVCTLGNMGFTNII